MRLLWHLTWVGELNGNASLLPGILIAFLDGGFLINFSGTLVDVRGVHSFLIDPSESIEIIPLANQDLFASYGSG